MFCPFRLPSVLRSFYRFPGDWELVDASAGAVSSSLTTRLASSVDARNWHPALESSASRPNDPTQPIQLPTQPMLLPEECFERVEMRFRAMLRKRHVPLGILANLEEDLTTFFTLVRCFCLLFFLEEEKLSLLLFIF